MKRQLIQELKVHLRFYLFISSVETIYMYLRFNESSFLPLFLVQTLLSYLLISVVVCLLWYSFVLGVAEGQ